MFVYQAFDFILVPLVFNQIDLLKSDYFERLLNRHFNPLFGFLFVVAGLLAYNTSLFIPLITTSLLINALGFICLMMDYFYLQRVKKRLARMEIYLMFFVVNGLQGNSSE